MAKVKIENDVRPYESNSQWKKDLLSLMRDFCIPPEIAQGIIRKTERDS